MYEKSRLAVEATKSTKTLCCSDWKAFETNSSILEDWFSSKLFFSDLDATATLNFPFRHFKPPHSSLKTKIRFIRLILNCAKIMKQCNFIFF